MLFLWPQQAIYVMLNTQLSTAIDRFILTNDTNVTNTRFFLGMGWGHGGIRHTSGFSGFACPPSPPSKCKNRTLPSPWEEREEQEEKEDMMMPWCPPIEEKLSTFGENLPTPPPIMGDAPLSIKGMGAAIPHNKNSLMKKPWIPDFTKQQIECVPQASRQCY